MGITTFEKAKVGDRVWSSIAGWGIICEINLKLSFPISVVVVKPDLSQAWYDYTLDGKYTEYGSQCLFWNEIKFEVPEMPKRVAKKEFSKWRTVNMEGELGSLFFDTKEECQAFIGKSFSKYSGVAEIKYEIEEEEENN